MRRSFARRKPNPPTVAGFFIARRKQIVAKSQTRNTGLIDVLASMMQQNMQQAPMQPMMYADATAAARPATFGGTGLADSAADIKKLFPTWQSLSMDAKINGQPFPTFREWLIMQGGNATAMPR